MVVKRQYIPLFSVQEPTIKNPFGQKFTLIETFKTKKNIGYSSRYEGGVPIFLNGNHVLRKTCKKRKNF
jgi:hypothetical protein